MLQYYRLLKPVHGLDATRLKSPSNHWGKTMESGPIWFLLLALVLQLLQTLAAVYPHALKTQFRRSGILRVLVSPQRDGGIKSIRCNGSQTFLLLIKVRYIGVKPLEISDFSKNLILDLPLGIEILEAFVSGLRPATLSAPDFQFDANRLMINPFTLNPHDSFSLVLILNEKVDYDSVAVSLTLRNAEVIKCDDSKSFWQKHFQALLRIMVWLGSLSSWTRIAIGAYLFFNAEYAVIGLAIICLSLFDAFSMLYLLRKYFSYLVKE